MKDRRSNKRVNVDIKAILHNGDEVARARIINLDKGGLFLWTQWPDLKPGTDVSIDIDGENIGVLGITGYIVRRCPLGLAVEIKETDNNFGRLVERESR